MPGLDAGNGLRLGDPAGGGARGALTQSSGVLTWEGAPVYIGPATVKSFGAVGDGVHDDTLAVAASIAATGRALFTDGTYLIAGGGGAGAATVAVFHVTPGVPCIFAAMPGTTPRIVTAGVVLNCPLWTTVQVGSVVPDAGFHASEASPLTVRGLTFDGSPAAVTNASPYSSGLGGLLTMSPATADGMNDRFTFTTGPGKTAGMAVGMTVTLQALSGTGSAGLNTSATVVSVAGDGATFVVVYAVTPSASGAITVTSGGVSALGGSLTTPLLAITGAADVAGAIIDLGTIDGCAFVPGTNGSQAHNPGCGLMVGQVGSGLNAAVIVSNCMVCAPTNGLYSAGGATWGLTLYGAINSVIRDCRVYGAEIGIQVLGTSAGGLIEGVRVESCLVFYCATGIVLDATNACIVTACIVDYCGVAADVNASQAALLLDTWFGSQGYHFLPITAFPRGYAQNLQAGFNVNGATGAWSCSASSSTTSALTFTSVTQPTKPDPGPTWPTGARVMVTANSAATGYNTTYTVQGAVVSGASGAWNVVMVPDVAIPTSITGANWLQGAMVIGAIPVYVHNDPAIISPVPAPGSIRISRCMMFQYSYSVLPNVYISGNATNGNTSGILSATIDGCTSYNYQVPGVITCVNPPNPTGAATPTYGFPVASAVGWVTGQTVNVTGVTGGGTSLNANGLIVASATPGGTVAVPTAIVDANPNFTFTVPTTFGFVVGSKVTVAGVTGANTGTPSVNAPALVTAVLSGPPRLTLQYLSFPVGESGLTVGPGTTITSTSDVVSVTYTGSPASGTSTGTATLTRADTGTSTRGYFHVLAMCGTSATTTAGSLVRMHGNWGRTGPIDSDTTNWAYVTAVKVMTMGAASTASDSVISSNVTQTVGSNFVGTV